MQNGGRDFSTWSVGVEGVLIQECELSAVVRVNGGSGMPDSAISLEMAESAAIPSNRKIALVGFCPVAETSLLLPLFIAHCNVQ